MRILKINQKNFHRAVMIATEAIKTGKVVVCPTDTVYGLLADATNKKAVERLFKIKKRPKGKPLPIFVRDLRMAKRLVVISEKQEKILREFWPGKITAVLKKKARVKIFGIDKNTIGLRVPNYKLVNILLAKLNRPLTGTSANISGEPASTRIKEVISQFKNEQVPRKREQKIKPDLVLDAGDLKSSKSSTVVDLTGKKMKTIRQ